MADANGHWLNTESNVRHNSGVPVLPDNETGPGVSSK